MERIVVNTHEMFENCMSIIGSCLWDDPTVNVDGLIVTARYLSDGDMNGIRECFKCGDYVSTMLGNKMDELSKGDEKEIEVIHDVGDRDKVIGVLVPYEICY